MLLIRWIAQICLCTVLLRIAAGNRSKLEVGSTIEKAAACSCDLENQLTFLKLHDSVQEHSARTDFRIDTTAFCASGCLVFGRQPNANSVIEQGNWTIDRQGVITFVRSPHKTGVAHLGITIQEVNSSYNYIANVTYSIEIIEEPDWPIVFISRAGEALPLNIYSDMLHQFRNISLTVEQNIGSNTAYADLRFTAGAFDFDAAEVISVKIKARDAASRGVVTGMELNSISPLHEAVDCNETELVRLANRNLTEWDTGLSVYQPCQLTAPKQSNQLSWFSHLGRYQPRLGQSGVDSFVLTYTDKHRLEAKIFVTVYILQNPCINGGVCRGPVSDLLCTNRNRSLGFFDLGYRCQCEYGWVGDRCEIEFNDCFSSSCPAPYICKDKFRDFKCVCPENQQNCVPLLKMWQVATIMLGTLLAICLIVSILILCGQRKPLVVKIDRYTSGSDNNTADKKEPFVQSAGKDIQLVDTEAQTSFIEEEAVESSMPLATAAAVTSSSQREEASQESVSSAAESFAVSIALSPIPQRADFSSQYDLPVEAGVQPSPEPPEWPKQETDRIRYRQSFSRSRSLIGQGLLPRRTRDIPEDSLTNLEETDLEMEASPVPYSAADAQLLQIQRNRKALSEF